MKKKRIRIASKIRFTFFLSICIIISLTIISQGVTRENKKRLTYQNFIEIKVRKGDTLWNIAKENDNRDKGIREKIYEIMSLNGMESANINPGDIIIVPTN